MIFCQLWLRTLFMSKVAAKCLKYLILLNVKSAFSFKFWGNHRSR